MNKSALVIALLAFTSHVLMAADERPSLKAVINQLNEPGAITVTLNIGSDDGVKTGDIFRVYRDNKQIGKLKITEVDQDQATAKITQVKDNEKLKTGDRAIRKG
jgi:hypothetical protein